MKKKNINIWKVIWVVGIFAILLIILYLVVEYKVKYEDFSYNKIEKESPSC